MMSFSWNLREHLALGNYGIRWLLLAGPVAAFIGSACALFLWALDRATATREANPWLLFLLPLGGIAVGLLYSQFGRSVEGGNNLIMEQIHEAGGGVPSRMAPLVLIGTVVTHLFGGSAGREGTAVQMGGSIASTFGRWLKLDPTDMRTLLMTGIAAGFGAVFGTPLTGAVFAMEVLAVGRMSYEAIVPCLMASVIGDWACGAWGIHHTHYHIATFSEMGLVHSGPRLDWGLAAKVALASVAFGLTSVLFAELTHGLQHFFKKLPWPAFRPAIGALVVIALVYLLGTRDYLGLGVTSSDPKAVTILSCFQPGGAQPLSWWWKLLFTAVTLSSGFKGGEVTPLFFIGAALGHVLAGLLNAPVDLFAGLGFVAVFAGATNTPLACTIMGIELFGSDHVVYMALACFLSYLFSGHSGIYLSQLVSTPKLLSSEIPAETSLRSVRELQQALADGMSIASIAGADALAQGGLFMSHRHKVIAKEIGQVRIYMQPGTRRKASNFRERWQRRPLYQEIIAAAKVDGILNATAHHTHYGYSGNGAIVGDTTEIANPNLNLCIELIGERDLLELFCRKHGDLLAGRVIVYKHMEHWDLQSNEIHISAASTEELDADVTD